jgi:hypothetical protein
MLCWNIIYSLFSLRFRLLQFYLLLLPISLYLVFGLSYIPYGLHSCRSHSFIILLQRGDTIQISDRRPLLPTTGEFDGVPRPQ